MPIPAMISNPLGGGTVISPRIECLAGLVSTTTSVGHDVVGYARIDPATYARSGETTVLTLEAFGRVVSGVTGTLVLYNLDTAATVATLAWTETAVTRKTASVAVPVSASRYELRVSKSGGAVSDFAVVGGATVLITWS
jgi:hypothetical protein